MRHELVERLRGQYPVRRLCRVLEVSRSGHYAHRHRGESRRVREDRQLKQKIVQIHGEGRGRYGTPRVHGALRNQGIRTSSRRVSRLRRELDLRVKPRRRYCVTTDSTHSDAVAPNRLKRCFEASGPNQVWVGDITYLRYGRRWLYLAFLLDLYSRRIVGWSVRDRMDETLPLEALRWAVETRRPARGLIHHTDRGATYCSSEYRKALASAGMKSSMSRKGDCWDNAVAESWINTLKGDLGREFAGLRHARQRLFEYIEGVYNTQRLHSTLGYLSPAEFERRAEGSAPASPPRRAVAPAADAVLTTASFPHPGTENALV